jgi:hypothetical protein
MIHVLFDASAAATFRQLLRRLGIAEKVAFLSEQLDFGPISHGCLADRGPWLDRHAPLDYGTHDWMAQEEAKFRRSVAGDAERLIWIAPASAQEQAGLYWYLSQYGDADLKMAVADFPLCGHLGGEPILKLNEVSVESMEQLYEDCPRTPWDASRFPRDRWAELVAENALLRVVDGGQLRSAPDDHFDQFLLARCPRRWVKWYRVLGDTLGNLWKSGQSAGVDSIMWRLRTLIEDGKIACDGALPVLHGNVSDAVKIRRLV